MNETLINGRHAEDWEIAAIQRGRACQLARDREQVAGLLSVPRQPEPPPPGRPVTDVPLAVLP